ncbi:hypothetical protein AJ79_09449 [Helicocarpus griseus UAMH5409]|uniref:Uncharacterized protein n=1 Tax=Helicocarpus griseus UAMH5409 TaxID=1447875 RepID=A0A2B7WJJ5_9EURO|nr:hypothetical protein AJ79_09449 [Helicocarpus griseus UAMH5409]
MQILQSQCNACGHPMSEHEDFKAPVTTPVPDTIKQPAPQISQHSTVYYRRRTVDEIAGMLDAYKVVHVRGTPASGKTTLAWQLQEYYQGSGVPVLFISLFPAEWAYSPVNGIIRMWHREGFGPMDRHSFMCSNVVVIFDEAQETYKHLALWTDLIKTQGGNTEGPRVCLFSSYGSPAAGATDYPLYTTPPYIAPPQRVSITKSKLNGARNVSLFYDEEEFEAVVDAFCQNPSTAYTLDAEARNYLLHMTNGHPGAVNSLLHFIFTKCRSQIKHRAIDIITKEHIVDLFRDEHSVFSALVEADVYAVARSFPGGPALTRAAADTLRRALELGSLPVPSPDPDGATKEPLDPGLDRCFRMGWLHREPLMKTLIHELRMRCSSSRQSSMKIFAGASRSGPFPITTYQTPAALCEAVLSRFSRASLSASHVLTSGAQSRPPEAQYQDEWYRACKAVLGPKVAVSSEWSRPEVAELTFTLLGRSGELNFCVMGTGWVSTVEGFYLEEHTTSGSKMACWLTGLSLIVPKKILRSPVSDTLLIITLYLSVR